MTTNSYVPIWNDPEYPSRARVAHWLFTEVQKGHVFTTTELREAIPGVAQIDRRMRDLRKLGWVIKTYREMPALKSHELYLDEAGVRIWETP